MQLTLTEAKEEAICLYVVAYLNSVKNNNVHNFRGRCNYLIRHQQATEMFNFKCV